MTLLVALGMPGLMSFWGNAALQAIAREAFVDHSFVHVETLDDLQSAWKNRTSEDVIVTSHYPATDLCGFLLGTKAPYIVFSENALDATLYLSRQMQVHDISIVRSLSASIACLSQMRSHSFLVNIERDKVSNLPIHRIVGHMCRKLGISLSTASMVRCLKHLGLEAAETLTSVNQIPDFETSVARINHLYAAPGDGCSELPDELRQLAVQVLQPFDGYMKTGQKPSLTWPHESFLLADKAGATAAGEIDLVGRARCLVYGPYFHLPAGEWNARFALGINQNIYGQIFTIEIHNSELLSKIRVRPSGTGSFAAEAAFHIERPKEPIEIRLFTDTGSIEGSIAYWSAELSPIDVTDPDSPPDMEDVLPERDVEQSGVPQEIVNHPK
ncbi:hypothetical protein HB779_01045 (plasmid) [Phyllobacterium sp. 628]|uniref:hypothetical protein n=1 Tax=Phyllobacterium sp. 628 TaxID=2718938 RepID=UPI0016623F94|nr:hypothetical protein [Phyllobacterium sp. 628]QND50597.1 hypothetical protein HB779_01045 [Phyllobacterium sp. 628]